LERTQRRYKSNVDQRQNSLTDFWKKGFVTTFTELTPELDRDSNWFYNNKNNTPYGSQAREMQNKISSRTYAGVAGNYSIDG
jgi:hypothetical protein